ncbi:MAG: hypothetical protein ACYC7E_07280 [Armatimonadota bacterium]
MDNTLHLAFIRDNILPLLKAGKYEEALLHCYQSTRANHFFISSYWLGFLFKLADRVKMQSLGDPLPPAPYTLYRGVAGNKNRRIRGISWTASRETAEWFANRPHAIVRDKRVVYASLPHPAVYEITLPDARHIWAYTNGRQEQEFYVLLPSYIKPKLVWGSEPKKSTAMQS